MVSALSGTLIRRKILGASFVSLSEHGRSQGIFPREREPPGLRGLGGLFQRQGFHGSRGSEEETRAPCGKEPLVSHGTSRSHQRHEPRRFPAPLDEFPAERCGFPGNAGRERKESGSLLPHSVRDPGSRSPFQRRRLLLPGRPLLARGSQMRRAGFAGNKPQSPLLPAPDAAVNRDSYKNTWWF